MPNRREVLVHCRNEHGGRDPPPYPRGAPAIRYGSRQGAQHGGDAVADPHVGGPGGFGWEPTVFNRDGQSGGDDERGPDVADQEREYHPPAAQEQLRDRE